MAEIGEYLTRKQAAHYLSQRGYLVAAQTLATKAWDGSGPPYYTTGPGRAVTYLKSELDKFLAETIVRAK